MDADILDELVRRLRGAGGDFSQIWNAVAAEAAGIVEIRHVPPSPALDGLRTREDFLGYVEEEARVFPRSFQDCSIGLEVQRAGSTVVWNPLSFSGRLVDSGRQASIRFRVVLHFADGKLCRVDGSPTADNAKADIIAWLKAVESIGGFNPPPPMRDGDA